MKCVPGMVAVVVVVGFVLCGAHAAHVWQAGGGAGCDDAQPNGTHGDAATALVESPPIRHAGGDRWQPHTPDVRLSSAYAAATGLPYPGAQPQLTVPTRKWNVW